MSRPSAGQRCNNASDAVGADGDQHRRDGRRAAAPWSTVARSSRKRPGFRPRSLPRTSPRPGRWRSVAPGGRASGIAFEMNEAERSSPARSAASAMAALRSRLLQPRVDLTRHHPLAHAARTTARCGGRVPSGPVMMPSAGRRIANGAKSGSRTSRGHKPARRKGRLAGARGGLDHQQLRRPTLAHQPEPRETRQDLRLAAEEDAGIALGERGKARIRPSSRLRRPKQRLPGAMPRLY